VWWRDGAEFAPNERVVSFCMTAVRARACRRCFHVVGRRCLVVVVYHSMELGDGGDWVKAGKAKHTQPVSIRIDDSRRHGSFACVLAMLVCSRACLRACARLPTVSRTH
jgi:hypothetical protein